MLDSEASPQESQVDTGESIEESDSVEFLKMKLSESFNNVASLETKLKKMEMKTQRESKELKIDLERAKEMLKLQKIQNEKRNKKLNEKIQTQKEAQRKLTELQETHQRFKQTMEAETQKTALLESKIKLIEDKHNQLQQKRHQQLRTVHSQATNNLAALNESFSKLKQQSESEIDQLKANNASMKAEVRSYERILPSHQFLNEKGGTIDSLTPYEALFQQKETLSSELAKSTEQHKVAIEEIKAAKVQNEQAQSRFAARLHKLQTENRQISIRLIERETALSEESQTAQRAQKQLSSLRIAHTELLASSQSSIVSLQDELQAYREHVQSLINTHAEQLNSVRLQQQRDSQHSHESQVRNQRQQQTQLLQTIQIMEADYAKLLSEFQDYQGAHRKAAQDQIAADANNNSKVDHAYEELAQIQEELAFYVTELKQSKTLIAKLEIEISALNQSLAEASKELERLPELEEFKDKNSALVQSISRLEAQNLQLKEEISDMTREMQEKQLSRSSNSEMDDVPAQGRSLKLLLKEVNPMLRLSSADLYEHRLTDRGRKNSISETEVNSSNKIQRQPIMFNTDDDTASNLDSDSKMPENDGIQRIDQTPTVSRKLEVMFLEKTDESKLKNGKQQCLQQATENYGTHSSQSLDLFAPLQRPSRHGSRLEPQSLKQQPITVKTDNGSQVELCGLKDSQSQTEICQFIDFGVQNCQPAKVTTDKSINCDRKQLVNSLNNTERIETVEVANMTLLVQLKQATTNTNLPSFQIVPCNSIEVQFVSEVNIKSQVGSQLLLDNKSTMKNLAINYMVLSIQITNQSQELLKQTDEFVSTRLAEVAEQSKLEKSDSEQSAMSSTTADNTNCLNHSDFIITGDTPFIASMNGLEIRMKAMEEEQQYYIQQIIKMKVKVAEYQLRASQKQFQYSQLVKKARKLGVNLVEA